MTDGTHWALDSFGLPQLEKAKSIAEMRLIDEAVGNVLQLEYEYSESDNDLLVRALETRQIAAAEYVYDLLHPSSDNHERREAGENECAEAFELIRAVPIPQSVQERILHVLRLIALAYGGQRWSDARRWVLEHEEAAESPSIASVPWDRRVVYRLFEAWICLVRKDGWNDLARISEIVAGLRRDQAEHEAQLLGGVEEGEKPYAGWTLAALYHWAAATELLATYLMQGSPNDVDVQVNTHFEKAASAARMAGDAEFEVLLQWLHVSGRAMTAGAMWTVARSINSRVTRYIRHITSRETATLFEMLPPQRAALLEEGLLDPAKRSLVINLPTSAGKTFLAIFRILQALNQFSEDGGWVAYTAPTRALVAQQTRRLRKELSGLGLTVEQLSGAVEVDTFEEQLLEAERAFDVLVTTPEKLDLVIKQGRIRSPLALIVVDEAHNIQDSGRGLKLELLLATVKRDCPTSSFLLLTPFVPNAEEVADWLAPDADSGKSISLGVTPWKPNDRIIGCFHAEQGEKAREWTLSYRTLQHVPRTVHLVGDVTVGRPGPLNEPFSRVANTLYLQAAAMAKCFAHRKESLVLSITANRNSVWSMARKLTAEMPPLDRVPDSIRLVQRFLRAEVAADFELCSMLEKGIAVHHSGLSDETRSLIEWLAEEEALKVVCATTTIAQGVNFPVSSIFLASLKYPYGVEIPPHDFWNLAGRAGRIFQESLGVIGIATKHDDAAHQQEVAKYISSATKDLVSTLEKMVSEVLKAGSELSLEKVYSNPEWFAFWGYLSHIYNQAESHEAMIAEAERVLRNTFGYRRLEKQAAAKARALMDVVKEFGGHISKQSHLATLADATGFSPSSLQSAIGQLRGQVSGDDWAPEGLFGGNRRPLQNLMGVMLNLPEVRKQLNDISPSGPTRRMLAGLATDWVNGAPIEQLAKKYFKGRKGQEFDLTDAVSQACRAIYGSLCISATWGLSTLSKLPTSGLPSFDDMDDEQRRLINALPAMLYYGVPNPDAVLMRMNSVPRSMAVTLGSMFERATESTSRGPHEARDFIKQLTPEGWAKAAPRESPMSGSDYREVWQRLSGET